ncbi:uncharacterized protein [Littorina saxatilis]|uniref:uncharacterized protein n=1 Tax=Littorina saxatilis TaxID=31220 RepID=UPI0038B4B8E3
MPGYSMELHNVNGETSSTASVTKNGKPRQQPGCHVSALMGFVLVLLAILVALGVGLLVFFTQTKEVTCNFPGSEGTIPEAESDAIRACRDWIEKGTEASDQICSVCPPVTMTTGTTTTAPSTTAAPSYPRDQYRLPTNVIPNHYTLRLQPHIYGSDPSAFYFEGSVTIDVTCKQTTDVITLHVDRLAIEEKDVSVEVASSRVSVNIRNISYEKEPHFYHIHLSDELLANTDYKIMFKNFRGNLSTDGEGLYISSYKDGDQTIYLATTQMEAPHARKTFPCFDEPAMKATFDTTLVRKRDTGRNYITLSNMNNISTTPIADGWVEDKYNTTMVMPTYLLAFVVCDYDRLSDNTMGIKYSTWARSNALQYAEKAQQHGLRLFEYFESRFNPNYSTVINKLDNIAIPDFNAGAMENWGLITYREALLYKPGVAAASDEDWIAEVIGHEIAHMWFGNLVSPKWWSWLWLNEAFASFWDFYSVGETYPLWRTTDVAIAQGLHSVMTSDALASSHPLTADVETRAEIDSIFDAVTYTKGSFVVRMMHFIMGQDNFIEALNLYLDQNKFGNAEHTDLWHALDTVGMTLSPQVNMTLRMDPWVTQMGFPVVTVTKSSDGKLMLSQQRFLLGTEDSTDDRYKDPLYNYKWEIPITYTSSENTSFHQARQNIHWLEKDRTLEISDPTQGSTDGWYVVNVQQYGYFRVNYDSSNWNALITQLKADHTKIHPVNRAQIINDAWNLVKADLLDMSTALRVLDYLSKELDYVPWRAFAREMDYVELMLDRSSLYSNLEEFMKNTVNVPIQDVGLDITPDLAPVDIYTKVQLADYACSYGHTTCVNLAVTQFSEWRTSGTNGIDANLRYRFYCTAVERGGLTEWNFVYDKYKAEDDATENSRLRRALACTKEPSLLHRLLQMSMNTSEIRTQDIRTTIQAVAGNRWGRDIAFHFVVEHFTALVGMMSASNTNRLIASITAHFNSEYHLSLLRLLESSGDSSAFTPAITTARTQTQANMDWLAKHTADLHTWLSSEEGSTGRLSYRLPNHVEPSHYTVRLQPYIYGNDSSTFYFDGECTIVVTCRNATNTITLHMDRLNISDSVISVKQENTQKELFQSTSYEETRHFYHLHLSEELQVGKVYHLAFSHFTGPLMRDGTGFYQGYYKDGEETVYLATTQMEPPYARKTFPCFDEPALKATFDITLVRRNDTGRNYISLANTGLKESRVVMDGSLQHTWIADTFNTTARMPTYLLAFIVCDYLYLENTTISEPHIPYRTYARPNAIQWAHRAQEYGLKLYDWMNSQFKPSFGEYLHKLDNVAVPDFNFGAMENWGLIIYREAILYQPGVTSASYEYWMGSVVCHEIAHMWFGDFVSPKWWDYLWLNEAFASWWDVYVTAQVFPEWRVLDEWVSKDVHNVMDSDALATSHPMTADVQTPAEVNAIFDGVTYNKGAAVNRMTQFIMGNTTYIVGLNLYLENNLLGNAEPSDLWDALGQTMMVANGTGGQFISEKMDPWVTQMGYPVVMVSRTAAGFRLTQKRFLMGSTDDTDDRYKHAKYNYQWEIPIIYTTSKEKNMEKTRNDVYWLSKHSELIIDDPVVNDTEEWILLNIRQMGYFRVLYDADTWQALIGQLNTDLKVFPALSRGQIINDAWNLAKAGMLNMSVALETLDFLQYDTDLVPWRAFAREMTYVEKMLERTDLFPEMKNFMQDTVKGPLGTLTLNIPEGMVPVDVFVRTLLAQYACTYGLVGCVNVAKRTFAEWKNTGTNSINANLRRQYYCTAVAEGDTTDWVFVYKHYTIDDDTTESTNLRHALSCTKDPVLLRRLLNMALDPEEIRTQDVATTIQWVAENPLGRDIAFQFYVDNFEGIKALLDVLYLGRTLLSTSSHFNTDYNLQQLQQFSVVRDTTVIKSVLDQAMAQTRTNIQWLRDNYNIFRDWLANRDQPSPPTPAGKYRLPKTLTPTHYDLRLKPNIYGNDSTKFDFEGTVKITFICNMSTNVITLHQDRLVINSSQITLMDVDNLATSLTVGDVTEEVTYHFYHVHLASNLTEGKTYTIEFPHFTGMIRSSGQGLYLSSYKDGETTIYLATTQMEPTYARQVFPCFDEPAMKATFTTTLVRKTDTDRDYISLSNMPLVSSNKTSESWTEDLFEQSMTMSTYLLAFIVCDYKYLNHTTRSGVESRTYARPNRIEDAETAHADSVKIFEWFNSEFKPPYQQYLSKVDHIAIPDFTAGAMENWGLITYREKLLINELSIADDRTWVATIIAHELAHMWFGNTVSPVWWDWLWLNEAFATYWQTYAVDTLYADWKNMEVDTASSVFYAMQLDGLNTSHPLTNPVETPAEINSQFDPITYVKGGAIIRMMHVIMGDHFIPALNLYLENNLLGNAEPKDLFAALDQYSDDQGVILNMTKIMDPWVTQMGYPVVNVHRVGGSLTLTQQRFMFGTPLSSDTGAHGYQYEIPITYTTNTEGVFNKSWTDIHWLHMDQSLNITLPEADADWVVVNLLHGGYFRVNYDTDGWMSLIAQLNTNHKAIHEMNRAAILDDAWNLVKADMLNLSIALKTVDYMSKEMDYGPWRAFARETDYMERMIEQSELFTDFQRFMQQVVDEPLNQLGFDMPPGNDPPVDVLLRSLIIGDACKYDHVTCVTKATDMVSDWRNGLGNQINVNLRICFYCTAVREGSHDVWDFIYRSYQAATDTTEKGRLRAALGCSRDPTVLMTFLDMCLYDDEISKSETENCINSVADNRYGRDVALNFVMENFPMLKDSVTSRDLGSIVSKVTQHFHSNYHLSQLQYLMDNYDVSSITSTMNRVKQTTVTNMQWVDKNFDIIKEWLASKVSGPSDTINYRLPTAILPYHYDLELQPEIYTADPADFTFNGSVKIYLECNTSTNVITLHSYRHDLQTIRDSAMLKFENETDTGFIAEVTYDEARHFLHVHLKVELQEGQKYSLYMEFSASMRGDGVGLYYSSYKDGDTTVYLATTKFEAPYARRAFPCFDEPAMKATFNVTLIRRHTYNNRQYNSKSNNERRDTIDLGNGYHADRFLQTPRSSTYLLAFIVSDFQCLENDTVSGVTYRTCARPNAYQHGHLAQDYGMREFTWLEEHFNPNYSMPKLDNMAIPDFLTGAMENWGLITYREDLLYEENVTTASTKSWMVEVVAHELTHMWFGNIVSPKWWNWLWLNEAFASFWDFHLVEKLEPTWRMTAQFVVQSFHAVMTSDSLQSSHPLTADVESPSEIQAIFDSVTYSKGAAFVRMINFIMGEDHFIAALNVYLHNQQYDVAEQQDLWDALDQYSMNHSLGLNLTELLDPWVTQKNYPVVMVHWTDAGQVTLTQERFLSSDPSTEDSAPYGYKWDIPITMATIEHQNFNPTASDISWFNKSQDTHTITNTTIRIPAPNGTNWVLVNVQQYGYYRVNYDQRTWTALIDQLNTDHNVIDPINRAQIINDAWSLAKAGKLNMSIALKTFNLLQSDSDYVPWQAMARELSYLDLMLSRTAIYGMFESYMVNLVNSTFVELGTSNSPADPPIQIFQRERIVSYACNYGIELCREEAKTQFATWKNNPSVNSIDVNMRDVIYCNAIRFGTKADWEFVLEQYKNTSSSSLRAALACTGQVWLLQRLLDMTLDSTVIRAQDVRSVVQAVSSNPVGRDMTWAFLQQHFDILPNFMTTGSFGRMVVFVTRHFNTQYQMEEVRRFMTDRDVSVAESSFRQILEQTSLNIAWVDKYFNIIKDFLEQNTL